MITPTLPDEPLPLCREYCEALEELVEAMADDKVILYRDDKSWRAVGHLERSFETAHEAGLNAMRDEE